MDNKNGTSSLLITGAALLYYGIDTYLNLAPGKDPWLAYLMVVGGMGLLFFTMAQMGDERASKTHYENRPKNPTHIKSINEGEEFSPVLEESELVKIQVALESGKVVEAIRLYRESTGHGLRESKAFIDRFLKELDRKGRLKN